MEDSMNPDSADAARAIDWKKIPWRKLAEVLKLILDGVGGSPEGAARAQGGGDPLLESALKLQLESAQLLVERIAGK